MTLRRALVSVAVAALLATACGSQQDVETTATEDAAAADASASVVEIGEKNQELLQTADDARDIEVLDVGDGSIATLRDAVDGDRPVLLWFYAPH